MRKSFVAGVVALLTALSALAVPATAAGAMVPATSHQVNVPFSGTSTFDFIAPACGIVHQVFDATLSTHRAGTLDLDGCVIAALAGPYTFEGSFTITIASHVALSGTATGSINGTSSVSCASGTLGASFDFTLNPTGGTRRLMHMISALDMGGTWCSPGTPDVPGPISGTLTVTLAHGHDRL
jgi:hypothetical protein